MAGWRPKRKLQETRSEQPAESFVLPPHFLLPTDTGQSLVYLEERGIGKDLCRDFDLRFCPGGFYMHARPDGHMQKQDFSNRVLIPIRDLDGEMKTFQGRDITGKAEAKYLFPGGLPAAARFLYNGYNCLSIPRLVICEGVFDVIRTHAALQEEPETRSYGVVGTFGMHLSGSVTVGSNDQLTRFIQLKERGLKGVTLLWDGERRAYLAALATAELLLSVGLEVKIGSLPEGQDPGASDGSTIRRAVMSASLYSKLNGLRMRAQNPYR